MDIEIKKITLREFDEDDPKEKILILTDIYDKEYYFRVDNGFGSTPLSATSL